MTAATKEKSPPSTSLARLERKRDAAHRKARAAREQRDAYDAETHEMRVELTNRRQTNPDEYEGADMRVKEGTDAAKLSDAIKARINSDNPHEGEYQDARATFIEADLALTKFQAENVDDLIAEVVDDSDYDPIREAFEQLSAALEQPRADIEKVRGRIIGTPGLTGQHSDFDRRVGEFYSFTQDALRGLDEHGITKPGLTPNARDKVS